MAALRVYEVELDVSSILEEAVGEADLSGLGADGESEYEVSSLDVAGTTLTALVTVDVERSSGKFASLDEIDAAITEAIEGKEGVDSVGALDSKVVRLREQQRAEVLAEIDANPTVGKVVAALAGRVDAETVALVLRSYAGVVSGVIATAAARASD